MVTWRGAGSWHPVGTQASRAAREAQPRALREPGAGVLAGGKVQGPRARTGESVVRTAILRGRALFNRCLRWAVRPR